ncbi:MAG: hypothetical protein K0Q90_4509 [Paenibacillaceae bacterium]|jgi:ABC-2 type transport system permease protein|nr:hypothetical protein [Paenibacillaceae bacterium]
MKSNRFYFNMGVIRQDLRQHGWIGILYLFGLVFSLPLQLMMAEISPRAPKIALENLFSEGNGDLQFLLILVFPVAAGIFIFRYLQSRGSADFQHSLPLTRERMFLSHLASGLILLVVPVLVSAIAVGVVKMLPDLAYAFRWFVFFKWMITLLVITVFMYMFTVFVGICTGQSILQTAVVFILLLLPAALGELWQYHFRTYLYGYPTHFINDSMNWSTLSPVVQLLDQNLDRFNRYSAFIYTALSCIFGAAAFFLYRRRKTEAATQAIAFSYFNPLFRGGVMICAMMVAGAYFHQSNRNTMGWTWFGYIAGAVIGFVAVEMLLQKSWQVFSKRALIRFGGYTALCALLLYVPVTNISGFVTRVPEAAQVGKTSLSLDGRIYPIYRNSRTNIQRDETYINAILELHKKLVTTRAKGALPNSPTPIQTMNIQIGYWLDDGSVLSRQYNTIPVPLIEKQLKPLMETEGYKRATFDLDLLDQSIDRITLEGAYYAENRYQENPKTAVITNPQEIKEFQDILKREILRMSYEDLSSGLLEWATINVLPSGQNNQARYIWSKSFKELDAWMTAKGYATKAKLIPANVTDLEVLLLNTAYAAERYSYPSEQEFEFHSSLNSPVPITDKQKIESVLENMSVYQSGAAGYMIKFKMTGTNQVIYGFVPEERLTP